LNCQDTFTPLPTLDAHTQRLVRAVAVLAAMARISDQKGCQPGWNEFSVNKPKFSVARFTSGGM